MKRFLVLLCALFAMGAVLAVAGPKQDSPGGGGGGKVLFWTSHVPPDSDVLRKIVDSYNATNPAVPVEMVQVPGSETDIAKLMTAVRGGTGPDVYMLDRFTIAQRAASGVLEDITPALAKIDPNLKSKYLDFAWAETQYNGKTYGLPFDTDARALFYRKDMIRAAGYDPELLDPKNGPITLDKLKEIALKINKTDAQGNYTQVGFVPYATEYGQHWHYTWGFAFGGNFADASGKISPTDQKIVDAMQWVYDWGKDMDPQKVRTFLSTYAPPNFPPQQNPFVAGKVAMQISGDWEINTLRTYAPEVDYGITYIPVPRAADKSTTWAGGWSFVVPVGSKQIDAAVKFIQYATGEAGQTIYTRDSAHLPTYKSLLSNASLYDERHKFFTVLLENARSRPVLTNGVLYWDNLTIALNDIAQNRKSPRDALQTVADTTK